MSTLTRSKTTIGSYRTLGDAHVLVIDRTESDESLLTPIVSAHCGGHGCVAEAPVEQANSMFLSMVDRTEKVTQTAKTVQEWAQQHAETCRATPAPGPHPAEQELPICGATDPERSELTCQLTAGHGWKHAAYTGGQWGYRHKWSDENA